MARSWLALAGFAAVIGFAPARAVPPPPEQMHVECAAPTYASDMLVCEDAELLALDRLVAEMIGAPDIAGAEPRSQWIEPQAAWFRRRSLCAMRAGQAECLRAAYRERIAVLSALAGPARDPMRACATRGPFAGYSLVVTDDGIATIARGSVVIVAGLARYDAKVWRPYAAFDRRKSRMRVRLPDGMQGLC